MEWMVYCVVRIDFGVTLCAYIKENKEAALFNDSSTLLKVLHKGKANLST